MAILATAIALLAASPGSFAISYERDGGLKPMPRELTIRPGRHAVATVGGSRTGGRTVRFRVGKKRIAELQAGLAEARFSELESSVSGSCADCYLYSIRYRGHAVRVDDAGMPAGLADVVDQLETLIDAHAIPPDYRGPPAAHRPFH